jgi:hypothetical protein
LTDCTGSDGRTTSRFGVRPANMIAMKSDSVSYGSLR